MTQTGEIESQRFMGKSMPIATVLVALAAGENCDGEPYDTMQAAADYILYLEAEVERHRVDSSAYWKAKWEADDRARRAEIEVAAVREQINVREPGIGKKAVGLAITVRDLEQKLIRLKRDLTEMHSAHERKNRELDALHYVWCSGGCEHGAHRYNPGGPETITFEIVDEAMRNTERLASWWSARQYRQRSSGKQSDERTLTPMRLISWRVFERWKRHYDSRIRRLEEQLAAIGSTSQ